MKAKTVVTIHDVFSVLQSTEFATPEFREMKRKRYHELVQRADRIVCVSECVQRDVLELLKVDPQKLRVVHESGGEGLSPARPRSRGRQNQAQAGPPVFHFRRQHQQAENVPLLIKAFAQARAAAKSDALFAIAGRVGFGGEEIRNVIEKSGATDSIRLLGYVPDEDIAPLYSGARGLIFATLYEGFGIPAIEAFACGCPVIGATTGSLPEIIGDSGLLAVPHSVDSIAMNIQKLMTDDALRTRCIESGLQRAKDFSWDKAAQECLQIYSELMAGK